MLTLQWKVSQKCVFLVGFSELLSCSIPMVPFWVGMFIAVTLSQNHHNYWMCREKKSYHFSPKSLWVKHISRPAINPQHITRYPEHWFGVLTLWDFLVVFLRVNKYTLGIKIRIKCYVYRMTMEDVRECSASSLPQAKQTMLFQLLQWCLFKPVKSEQVLYIPSMW